MNKTIVVIPSDRIEDYEKKGTSSWLKDYYNPQQFFKKVYVLSPIEKKERKVYGLEIIPVKSEKDYREKLKKINPLCVRAYGGYWATDYANYNKVNNIPVISSVHDTNSKLIYQSLVFSDLIISMSDVIKDKLINELKIKPNIIKVLGNRVDENIFKKIDTDNYDDKINRIRTKIPFKRF